ncbi:MAG: AMP-binding protein [Pseudomonadales bacterium]|nr:AMP-binding protein [Pseudomonadales bacterium]
MNSIGDWITYNANWAGDRPALRLGSESYTYTEMEAAVTKRCHLLIDQLGAKPGDQIAYLGFNSCEILFLLFACARTKCLLMPLNNRLALPEHLWILRHSKTRFLIYDNEFATTAEHIAADVDLQTLSLDTEYEAALQAAVTAPFQSLGSLDDPVLLLYTSGTTGHPKGVVHQQRALFYNALNAIHAQEMRALDHVLSVLPLFHSGGINIQTSPAFYVGAQVTLMDRFDPGATLNAIQEIRPTMFLAVPAVIQALVNHPLWNNTDLSCLRVVGTGSSTVPNVLLNAWHDRGVPATQIYGMTESAPAAICLPIAETQTKLGAAGKPVIHCEARIVDESGKLVEANERGEIEIRGPNLFSEYLNEPELTDAAFNGDWFRTGDIGHVDDQGYYYIDDRKKDVIISGGENIYPAELENVLADIPELSEYAVIGRPDEKWGEATVACVVLRDGQSLSKDELLAGFEGKLARYKHPQDVLYFESLPRNAMGKVLKYKLREQI